MHCLVEQMMDSFDITTDHLVQIHGSLVNAYDYNTLNCRANHSIIMQWIHSTLPRAVELAQTLTEKYTTIHDLPECDTG